jgi:hypothetical protein
MHCPHCNQEHPEGILFCPVNGKKILMPGVCPECGKSTDPNLLHCTFCGQKLIQAEATLNPQEEHDPQAPISKLETQIKSHKFGIGDLFSEGWHQYRKNFKTILLVILCVYIPINIIISIIPIDSLIKDLGTDWLSVFAYIQTLLQFFFGIIATIGIAAIVEKSLQGMILSWKDSLHFGLSKWVTAIGTGFLSGLIIFGLTLLLIVPGIIWSIYYYFWIFVVALRDVGGKTALDYSKSLVKGQWWRVFGIVFVIGIIRYIVELIYSLLINLIPFNPTTGAILGIFLNSMANIIYAFFTVVLVIFFINNNHIKNPAQYEQNVSLTNTTDA